MRLRGGGAAIVARPAGPRDPPEALVAGLDGEHRPAAPRHPVGAAAARGGRALGSAQPRLAPPAQRARRARGGRGGARRAARPPRSRPLGAMVALNLRFYAPARGGAAARALALAGRPAAPRSTTSPRPAPRSPACVAHALGGERGGRRVSAPPLRIGLVGCGRLAELGYVPASRAPRSLVLAAVADPVAGRRDRIAAWPPPAGRGRQPRRAPASCSRAADVDALVIASPPVEHLRQAQLARRRRTAGPGREAAGARRRRRRAAGGARPAPWIGFNRRFRTAPGCSARLPADGPLELELELDYRRAPGGR